MMADVFRHFYDYYFSENRNIWDSYITPLSNEQFTQDVGYSHGSVRNQILHLISVDDAWFSGLRGVEIPDALDPANFVDRNSIRGHWNAIEKRMGDYLADLRDKAILVRTDFSRHWGTESYFSGSPYLTAAASKRLVDARPALVGIDALNIDDIADMSRPAHTLLLGAGIPICEHMTNLGSLTSGAGRLHAVPIAWVGGATFPVRAYIVAT